MNELADLKHVKKVIYLQTWYDVCFSKTILVFLIIQSTFLHLSSADKKMKVMKNEEKEVRGGGMSHQDKDDLF